MGMYLNAWEVGEGAVVGADDRAGSGPRGGGDDQIVGAAGLSLVADMNEQLGVNLRHRTVVVEDRDYGQDVLEKGEARCSLPS